MMLDENVVLFSQGFMNLVLCSTGVLVLFSFKPGYHISTVVCLFPAFVKLLFWFSLLVYQ